MPIERITAAGAPEPKGPYSHAVRAGDFLFVSGQGPTDPHTNELSTGDIRHETRMVIENLRIILEGCGSNLQQVVKCSVFLADATDFAAMNEVYAEYFGAAKPARTTVQTGMVAPMTVEIDCIAYSPQAPALEP